MPLSRLSRLSESTPEPGFSISMGYAMKWIISAVASVWLGLSVSIQILCVLIVADWVTGALASKRNHNWSADKGRDGLIAKLCLLIMVGVVKFVFDRVRLPFDAASTVAFACSANELASIFRNCASAGVKVPQQGLDLILSLRRFGEKPKRRR